jgi:hypothetical protein
MKRIAFVPGFLVSRFISGAEVGQPSEENAETTSAGVMAANLFAFKDKLSSNCN